MFRVHDHVDSGKTKPLPSESKYEFLGNAIAIISKGNSETGPSWETRARAPAYCPDGAGVAMAMFTLSTCDANM